LSLADLLPVSVFKSVAAAAWLCIAAFLLVILYVNYDAYFSHDALLAKRNAVNIRKVRIGMDSVQVNKIMGPPEGRGSIQQDYIFYYTHQPGSSNSYQIKFSISYIVKEVGIID
jgi:hypothetical protein